MFTRRKENRQEDAPTRPLQPIACEVRLGVGRGQTTKKIGTLTLKFARYEAMIVRTPKNSKVSRKWLYRSITEPGRDKPHKSVKRD